MTRRRFMAAIGGIAAALAVPFKLLAKQEPKVNDARWMGIDFAKGWSVTCVSMVQVTDQGINPTVIEYTFEADGHLTRARRAPE